ncbi:hypothetical protein SAMN04488030_2552 [Aliiroseovarius halocynthiae]|nr:hypothetical protein SAMN04488030_2552 [Aliiroseovarius halocynthiae]
MGGIMKFLCGKRTDRNAEPANIISVSTRFVCAENKLCGLMVWWVILHKFELEIRCG